MEKKRKLIRIKPKNEKYQEPAEELPVVVMKCCKKCEENKNEAKDFYFSKGRYRVVCKACITSENSRHQRKTKSWLNRTVDVEKRRAYMQDYYNKNREKFVEYRRVFKEKYPDYDKKR